MDFLFDDYYGKEEYEKYGDLVSKDLSGKVISKSIALADYPGGIKYEADRLGLDLFCLLHVLEGMCYNNKAREISDSEYLVL